MAAPALTARTMYSVGARRRRCLGSRTFSEVNRRKVPIGGIVVTATGGLPRMLLGLNSAAVGSLITFGTAGILRGFLLIAHSAP